MLCYHLSYQLFCFVVNIYGIQLELLVVTFDIYLALLWIILTCKMLCYYQTIWQTKL